MADYDEFADSKVFCKALNGVLEIDLSEPAIPGYLYLDQYYILQDGLLFTTVAGNQEFSSESLSDVEEWLWDNFVEGEVRGPND